MKSGYLLKMIVVLCLSFSCVEANTDIDKAKINRKHVPKVEVYGKAGCPYCKKARAYFDKKNIPYKYYDVEKDKNALKRAKSLTVYYGVPIVVIGKEVIEGYSPESYDDYIK